jgi:predicted transcriptional regulator
VARVQEIRRRLQKPRATVDRTLQALHTLELLVCEESEEERGEKTVSVWRYSLADSVDLRVLDEPAEDLFR